VSRDRHLPEWLAERAALGEAPDVELDPARRRALEASDRAILDALPPAMVAAEIERRLRARHRRELPRRVAIGAALAAAAVLFVVFAVRLPPVKQLAVIDPPRPPESTRIKGDPRLVVHRKSGDAAERLDDGARAAPGDVIQLSYVAAGRRFGAIVSLDGRGAITIHLPDAKAAATAAELGQGGAVPLADAYELDDAPGFERFVLVTSRRPFSAETVRAAAARLAAEPAAARSRRLDLPAALEQHSFILRKEPPR
jgi:hypothetical protein